MQAELKKIEGATFPEAKAQKFEAGIQKSTAKVEQLKQKLAELKGQKVETAEFKKISQDLDTALQKLDEYYKEAQSRIDGLKLPEDTDPTTVMSEKTKKAVQETEAEADRLQEIYDKMRENGTAWTTPKETASTEAQLQSAEAELNAQTEAYASAREQFEATKSDTYANTATELTQAQAQMRELTGQMQQATAEPAESWFSRLGSVARGSLQTVVKAAGQAKNGIQALGKVAGMAKTALSKIGTGVKNITGIGKQAHHSSNMVEQFGKRIWGLAKRVFIFSVITKALRAVRSAFGEGINYYLGWDKALAQQTNNLKNSVQVLKGTFGGAFAPIVEIVVPILQGFVSWLTTAVNAIGAFIAALTGKSTYKTVVASTADAGKDASKSIGDTTNKVKDLKKELAHFDELNVINDQAQAQTPTGGSGAGAQTGGLEYRDATIGSSIADFAKKLKEAWENADFTDIGKILGEKLNAGLDSIPWEKIQATARKLGKSFATLINGFVEVPGLGDNIGRTIAEAINTGLYFVQDFVHNLHFDSVGEFIADGINGALSRIDWKNAIKTAEELGAGIAQALNRITVPETFINVANTIAQGLNTIVTAFYEFGTNYDFAQLGQSIGEGINTLFTQFDWGKFGKTITAWVSGIETTLAQAIESIDLNKIISGIGDFFQNIDWGEMLGKASDILDSISAKLAEVNWLKLGMDIVDYIVNAVSKVDWGKVALSCLRLMVSAFIASNALIIGLGASIISWLWKGIKEAVTNFPAWIKKNIVDPFIKKVKEFFGISGGEASSKMKGIGSSLILGLIGGITGNPAGIVTAITGIWGTITGAWKNLGNGILSLKVKVTQKATELLGTLKEKWEGIKQQTKELIVDAKEKVKGALALLKTKWEAIKEHTKEKAKELYVSAKEKVAGVLAKLKALWDGIKNGDYKKVILTIIGDGVKFIKDILPNLLFLPAKKTLELSVGLVKMWTTIQEWFNTITGGGKVSLKVQAKEDSQNSTNVDKSLVPENWGKNKGIDQNLKLQEWNNQNGRIILNVDAKITDKSMTGLQKQLNAKGYTASVTKMKDNIASEYKKINGQAVLIGTPEDKLSSRNVNTTATLTGTPVDRLSTRDVRAIANFKGKPIDSIAEKDRSINTRANFTGRIIDSLKDKTIYEMTASILGKTIARGFDSTIPGMKASIISYMKARGWNNNIPGMSAILNGFTKGNGWKNNITGMNAVLNYFTKSNSWKSNGYDEIGMKARFYKYVTSSNWKSNGWNSLDMLARVYSVINGTGEGSKYSFLLYAVASIISVIGSLFSSGKKKAKGGIFTNGSWEDLPQYATGGSPSHGTLFVAGEAGSEIVGTIGGRTEVLNRSQIAMAIYSAVVSAMRGFNDGIQTQIVHSAQYLGYHLDKIPAGVGSYIPDASQIAGATYSRTAQIDYNKLADAMASRGGAGGGAYTFTANLDGREIFRETVNQNDMYKSQTGVSAFA